MHQTKVENRFQRPYPVKTSLGAAGQRFVIIRDGHEGTGMLPDTTLSNQEIRDVVVYLATLRDTARQAGK
jgi:hypothetical protein